VGQSKRVSFFIEADGKPFLDCSFEVSTWETAPDPGQGTIKKAAFERRLNNKLQQ